MAETVIEVIKLFISKIGLAPKMQQLYDELVAMIEHYHAKNKMLMLESDYADIKQQKRNLLTEAAVKIVSEIKLYAAMENNLITANKVDLYYVDLYRVAGDTLVDTCTEIADIADDLGAKLTDYNVTAADVTGFRIMNDDFSKMLSAPRMDIAARAAINTEMINIIKEIRIHLKTKMDKSMISVKKNEPEFFNAYTGARVIVDLKGKRNKGKSE